MHRLGTGRERLLTRDSSDTAPRAVQVNPSALCGPTAKFHNRGWVAMARGSTWDPNVPGPLDRCLRCWTPAEQDRAYCLTCGRVSLVFSNQADAKESCYAHSDRAARRFCCLCARPVCAECNAEETYSVASGISLWHCRECRAECHGLENEFFATIQRSGTCAKHSDLSAVVDCKVCGLPICLSCTYFTVKGILRRTIADGPFCLSCFRGAVAGTRIKRWFSGHDVSPALL
jgi:hypothetical protein